MQPKMEWIHNCTRQFLYIYTYISPHRKMAQYQCSKQWSFRHELLCLDVTRKRKEVVYWFMKTSLYSHLTLLQCLRNLNRLLGTFEPEGMLTSLLWVFTARPLQLVKLWRRLGIYGQLMDSLSCLLWVNLTSAGYPDTQTSWNTSVLN